VGLNLIGANRLVLFDPAWNPATDLQAMGRVWRDGQAKRVHIYRLMSVSCIDEKIFQRQMRKTEVAESMEDKDGGGFSRGNFDVKDIKAIFAFKSTSTCETYDLLCAATAKDQVNAATELGWEQHSVDALPSLDDPVLRSLTAPLASFLFRRDSSTVAPMPDVAGASGDDDGDGDGEEVVVQKKRRRLTRMTFSSSDEDEENEKEKVKTEKMAEPLATALPGVAAAALTGDMEDVDALDTSDW
jgi:hypothetical protein